MGIFKEMEWDKRFAYELKNLKDIMKEYDGWEDLAEDINDLVEKVEGEQNG